MGLFQRVAQPLTCRRSRAGETLASIKPPQRPCISLHFQKSHSSAKATQPQRAELSHRQRLYSTIICTIGPSIKCPSAISTLRSYIRPVTHTSLAVLPGNRQSLCMPCHMQMIKREPKFLLSTCLADITCAYQTHLRAMGT